MQLIDLTGKTFGKLTVIGRVASSASRQTKWLCRCGCGNEKAVQAANLKNGHTTSCGCWQHGQTNTPAYRSWTAMNSRCHLETNPNFPHYGGRGIRVCDRWRESFEAFLADMGERAEGTTLDRIDVNGNYEPGNCRWATKSVQRKNQRPGLRGNHIEFNGKRLSVRGWAAEVGISEGTLGARLRAGIPVESALTSGIHAGRSRAGKARHAAITRRD